MSIRDPHASTLWLLVALTGLAAIILAIASLT